MVTIYRVFFRKPKGATWGADWPEQLVESEAERDRLMTRPTRRGIHWEVAEIHQCEACSDRRPWGPGWQWFGTMGDLEDGKPVRIFCSDQCRPVDIAKRPPKEKGLAYREWPHILTYEPLPSRAERWKILRDVGDPTSHRKVPMPPWPGPGTCRWCLKPTVFERGKKMGQPAPDRNWHNACYYQYQLHTELAAQFDFLFTRDGPRCQICAAGGYAADREFAIKPAGMSWKDYFGGAGGDLPRHTLLKPSIKLEVDHVIPLWKVVLLYPRRREFYGPVNLWLLCEACHKAKSADEAAERAAVKRSTAAG